MELFDFLSEKKINLRLHMGKQIMTVFDLSYILVDLQAVINGFDDIIYDIHEAKQYSVQKQKDEDEIVLKVDDISGLPAKVAESEPVFKAKTSGYKATTSRNYNKRRRENLKLCNFSKGSLILDITSSILTGIFVEFLKEIIFQQRPNEPLFQVNIQNYYIRISDQDIQLLPKNNKIADSFVIKEGINASVIKSDSSQESSLDAQNYIHELIAEAKPDANIESSVKRLLGVLKNNGIINQEIGYDSKGMKTFLRDTERFIGNLVDVCV